MMIEVWHVLENILRAVESSGYLPLLINAVVFFEIGKRAIREYSQVRDTGFAAGVLSFCGYFVWTYNRIGVPVDAGTSVRAICLGTVSTGVAWIALALATFLYRSGPGLALKTLRRHRDS